jgi:hypothetical protein
MKQSERVRKSSTVKSVGGESGLEEDKLEVNTETGEVSTRKHSHTSHSEKSGEYDDIYDDEEEDEELPSN